MSASTFTTQDYVTLALAAWGALLSTFLAVRQVRRDRPSVKVKVGLLVDIVNDEMRTYYQVRVVNMRNRPIELTGLNVRLRDRINRRLVPRLADIDGLESDRFPLTLADGAYATFYIDKDALDNIGQADAKRYQVRAVRVRDPLDREYVGYYRTHTLAALWRRFQLRRLRRRIERRTSGSSSRVRRAGEPARTLCPTRCPRYRGKRPVEPNGQHVLHLADQLSGARPRSAAGSRRGLGEHRATGANRQLEWAARAEERAGVRRRLLTAAGRAEELHDA